MVQEGGHSKSSFVVGGGGGSLKIERKQTEEEVLSLSVCSLFEKNCLIFQIANRVLCIIVYMTV